MQKIDTVLFDLDGTLLPLDLNQFLQRYFQLLSGEFKDLAEPEKFINIVMKATEEMIINDGRKTNKKIFQKNFFSLLKIEDKEFREKLKERFDEFYQKKFPRLQNEVEADPEAKKLVELFKQKSYSLVIATNPLFPRSAIMERITWADLEPDKFDLITSYENMHY